MALEIKAKNDVAEILIYDSIGDTWLGGISAKEVKQELNKLKVKDIDVRLNSEGGSVIEGVAIYNSFKAHQARIKIYIDGLAASIASIIAMSGDEIHMAENAFFMIHDPWVVTAGTSEELRKQADTMDLVRKSLLETYVSRTGGDENKISKMMTDETWLDSKAAYDNGFVDSITSNMQIAAKINPKMRFHRIPEKLKNCIITPEEQRVNKCEAKNINVRLKQALRRQGL